MRSVFFSTGTCDLEVDHVVIGGGVVGVAVGAALVEKGATLLLERHGRLGEETTSRNSEVVHGGFYYPTNSLKTSLCVEGRERLYTFCESYGVPVKKIGKWIVAQTGEEHFLDDIAQKAAAIGVPLRWLSQREVSEGEPNVSCVAAVESPETGIVDSHRLVQALEGKVLSSDGEISLATTVVAIEHTTSGFIVTAEQAGTRFTIATPVVVNSAGLAADTVAKMAMGDTFPDEYRLSFCKGRYFRYQGKPLVSRLVYPTPEPNLKGLGIHATVDLAGSMKFGPDTEFVEDPTDFVVGDQRAPAFAAAAMRYLPTLDPSKLGADYAGMRPKLSGPGQPFRDFVISEETHHGLRGLVNLVGIESPGLTASLAIGAMVQNMLHK